MYCVLCILYTVCCVLCTVYCVLYTILCIVYCVLFTVGRTSVISPQLELLRESKWSGTAGIRSHFGSSTTAVHPIESATVDFDPKATSFALAMAAPVADLQQLLNTMAVLPQAMTANAQIAAASVPAEGGSKDGGKGRYIHQRLTARSRSSTGARKSERSSTSTWAPQGVPGAAQDFEDH